MVRASAGAPDRRGVRDASHGDLADPARCAPRCSRRAPDELYHLAAPTFVPASWEDPAATLALDRRRDGDAAAGRARGRRGMRVLVASSGEIFGDAGESPQNERLADAPALALRRREARRLRARRHAARRARPARVAARSPTTTSRRAGPSASCRARSRAAPRRSSSACRTSSRSATCARCATGATRATSCAATGSCSSSDEPGDYILASGVGRTVGELVDAAFAVVGLDPGEPRPRRPGVRARRPSATPPVGDPSRARERAGLGARDQLRGDDRRDGRGRSRRPARYGPLSRRSAARTSSSGSPSADAASPARQAAASIAPSGAGASAELRR